MAIRQTTNCFPETFQGLLSRYLGILPNFFQGMFRDFCPIIWAFCVFFPGHISGTSVPLSGHSAFFFLREPFRDFCPVISAFCRFFFRKHFRDFCPVIWAFCGFFSGNISGTSVPLSGHSANFFLVDWQKPQSN